MEPYATVIRPGRVKLGAVGSPLPGVELAIADDGSAEGRTLIGQAICVGDARPYDVALRGANGCPAATNSRRPLA